MIGQQQTLTLGVTFMVFVVFPQTMDHVGINSDVVEVLLKERLRSRFGTDPVAVARRKPYVMSAKRSMKCLGTRITV